MLKLLLALLLALPILGTSQNEKPSSLSQSPFDQLSNRQTRAVVVGISDYQDSAIPDLRFADRDAEAFTHWLRALVGLALPDSNIVFLKNTKAT